jgi:hypothetical protein
MATEVTISGLFYSQVCSDQPLESVIAWMDAREASSERRWSLASLELMAAYGDGDPPEVTCAERPGHTHYLLVVPSMLATLMGIE